MSLAARFVTSVKEIPAEDWNRVAGDKYPFHRHEFLTALENSECVGERSGWIPFHLVLEDEADNSRTLAILPLYQKLNSEGEFVFDFAWARAYHQAGLSYFPKLVAAIPFTPVTCNCFLIDPQENAADIREKLIATLTGVMRSNEISSLHLLFPTEDEQEALTGLGLLARHDCQFHWHNDNYSDFDDFLSRFTAKKRKKTKRERRKVSEAGISFDVLEGTEMTEKLWDAVAPLYSSTFLLRGRAPYINTAFFKELSRTLPEAIVVIIGYKQNEAGDREAVSTAICFKSNTTLYGRYWGALGHYDSLHFETCYYQGIEYCIKHGLELFEPGTQGEHKLARGFTPTTTHSAHWISDERFAGAIAEYLEQEGEHVDAYSDMLAGHTPYKAAPQESGND